MARSPLDDLEQELLAAARRRTAPRRLRVRGALAVVAALLGTGGVAFAAAQLLDDGAPVAYPSGRPATATSGFGLPVEGSVKLLDARPEDPEGGPPWGVRVFRTTRGYGCLQVGRVVRGRLGLLGEGGSFDDDGRFHELRPGVILTKRDCVPLDATGHAHLAMHDVTFPASGRRDCVAFPGAPEADRCAVEDLRTVDVGFAGPEATRIAYRGDGEERTQRVEGPDGAYLVVQRSNGPTPTNRRGEVARTDYVLGATPGAGLLTRVDYRDGTSCAVREAFGPRGGCPDRGPVPRQVELPPTDAVRSPVRVRLTRRDGRIVVLTRFRARVAATGADSAYTVSVAMPDFRRPLRPGRNRCHSLTTQDVDRDVPAGRRVLQAMRLEAPCTGTYVVRVEYRVASRGPRLLGQLRSPGRTVGVARVRWTGR